MQNYSAIILAAGKSERMFYPKLALYARSGRTFAEELVCKYQKFGCREIILVSNDYGFEILDKLKAQFPTQVRRIVNKFSDSEKFYSLKIGACALNEIHPTFVHNIDNPFVPTEVLEQLLSNCQRAQRIIPVFENTGGHPILVSEEILTDLRHTHEHNCHLRHYFERFTSARIAVNTSQVLLNLNTKREYLEYLAYSNLSSNFLKEYPFSEK